MSDTGLEGLEDFAFRKITARIFIFPVDPGLCVLCVEENGLPLHHLRGSQVLEHKREGQGSTSEALARKSVARPATGSYGSRRAPGLTAMEPGFPPAHPETTGVKTRG